MARSLFSRFVKTAGAYTLGAIAAISVSAQAFAADAIAVKLKPQVNVEGADIRMGDLFEGAGDAGLTVFGMAPGPGRSMSYSASYVQAKAKQAGLTWNNAEGLATVIIARGGAAPAQTEPQNNLDDPFAPPAPKAAPALQRTSSAPDLKRGDTVQIVYRAPGIQLMATGKATADASVGGKAKAVNIRSNKTVDGVLVAPGRIEAYSFNAAPEAQTAQLDQNQ